MQGEATALKRYARAAVPGALGLLLIVALAYELPRASRIPIYEASTWGLVVLAAFLGYGSLLRALVVPDLAVDWGLRAAWGAAVVCVLGGILAALSLMTRQAALLIVELGALLALFFLARERARVERSARFLVRACRHSPLIAILGATVLAMCALHYVGGVCEWHTNPYDDDIAYLAFVRKLLDTGTLIEPFSLRRLAALGGQTLFASLVWPRSDASQGHTFDRGVAFLMVVLLVVGHRRRGRRPAMVLLFLALACFLTLPSVAINTASYFSGAALFLALYRTLTLWMDRQPPSPLRAAVPIALLSAALCSLRQNFVPVVPVMLAVSYAFTVKRSGEPWRNRLAEPALVAGLTLLFLLPWLYLSWASNRTFLYPFMKGTYNPAASLANGAAGLMKELANQASMAIEAQPVRTLFLFVLAALVFPGDGPRRPLLALLAGALVGDVLLTHAFAEAEPENFARYTFGFVGALMLAVLLHATTARSRRSILDRTSTAVALAALAACIQLGLSRTELLPVYQRFFRNIDLALASAPRSPRTARFENGLYGRLQAAIPAGEPVAVLLDEPYYLDYRRNRIFNLDMPGYSSLPPGQPYFQGSEKVADYFRGLGVRHLAFVRGDHSRYQYRREYWLEVLAWDSEVWRVHAAYELDLIDSLADLAKRYPVRFEERGLVVVDLGGNGHAA